MASIFKNIGKGVGYFFAFPFLLVAIAVYAVFGLVVFFIQFIKLIVLFFTGRTLFSDLPEDIKVKAILDDKVNGSKEVKEEADPAPQVQEQQTSSAPISQTKPAREYPLTVFSPWFIPLSALAAVPPYSRPRRIPR